jgi:uncharacterized protein (DUF2235 family)
MPDNPVKNLVVCCDGTANEFARDRTNVVKLFFTLVHDPIRQVVFYHPGVGTMEPPGSLTRLSRGITKLLGRAIGFGLEADIRDTYAFLMNHFNEGDQAYFFGFSRGAYTVRSVTALLHMYGLLRPGNEPLIPYAIRLMVAINNIRASKKPDYKSLLDNYFDLARQFKDHFSIKDCNPRFVGVWDTVSSVGWIENPVRLPYTASNPDIAIGRHAIAIDERRAFFRTNLWHPAPNGGPKDVKQVWFPGVHCDVGGGYPESESGLSKIALEWMIKEAVAAGLLTDDARVNLILGRAGGVYFAPQANATMHESLTGLWRAAEFIPKRHYNWALKEDETRANR